MSHWHLLLCALGANALRENEEIWDEARLIDKLFADYDCDTAPFANNCTEDDPYTYHVGISTIVQDKIIPYQRKMCDQFHHLFDY